MEGTLGEIRLYPGDKAPPNWAICDGKLLSISTNNALFSLLGTTFGGNGTTTFGLPNAIGKIAIGSGNLNGNGQSFNLGDIAGQEYANVSEMQLPSHTHNVEATVSAEMTPTANASNGTTDDPSGVHFAVADSGDFLYSTTTNAAMASRAATVNGSFIVHDAGTGIQHNNIMPVTALNYIICVDGAYPPRS